MKAPIEKADIKAGDLIRWEMERREDAYEYRAGKDGEGYRAHRGALYLLDRPSISLPTSPTFGWVHFQDGDHWCGLVSDMDPDDGQFEGRRADSGYFSDRWNAERVTSFVHATAVPTEALDALRTAHGDAIEQRRYERHQLPSQITRADALYDFLTAVDEATS